MNHTSSPPERIQILLALTLMAILFALSFSNYLLFHTFVELFSVAVACGIFMIAWNTRRFMKNNFFLFLGIGFLFVGFIDLLHTLAYKNMGVFSNNDPNLPTQFWIAARYLQAATFVIAPFILKRKLNPSLAATLLAAAALLLTASIFTGVFPDCFIEGSGLTLFKKISEYIIALALIGSLLLIRANRTSFAPEVARLLYTAITILVASEMAFTLYTDVFGIMNKTGHFLKVIGFFFIYKALIEIGLAKPYELLFRELKKSEEALLAERNELRESEERYRRLYKDTPVMLHSIDRDGRIVNVSNFWLEHLGYSLGEVLCRKSVDFFTEASRQFAEETVLPQFFRNGFVSDMPFQVVKKNGEIIDVLLSASAERDENGEISRSFSVMMDVTERKRAEEKVAILNDDLSAQAYELQAANTELEAFNYTVSHDLRAPLGNISGCCSVLRDIYYEGLGEKGKEFLGHIENEITRMDKLIGTLLRFSRLGRQELQRTEVNLSKMATIICLELKVSHPDRQVEFSVAEEVRCNGDLSLLRIVLENLIGNAWKYTGKVENAFIEFGVTGTGEKPVYFVRDNGAGFNPEHTEKLFLPFQRLHSNEFDGFGIGLATVQKIIYRHGGNIYAEGTVGKGATFFFTLDGAPNIAAIPNEPAAELRTAPGLTSPLA